jgi:tyrosinase
VPFVIAGKFGTPSTNDKDTIIEAHLNTVGGPVIGTKALMVRVRKNANNLTASERARFLFAWQKFRNKVGDNYIQFQEMHRLATMAGDEAHMQPAFLSWHRTLLLHVERELQKLEPSVALHYWNWDAAAPNVFTQDFMGAPGSGGFVAEPVFAPSNPLNGWNTDLPFSGGELRRNTSDHTLDPGGAMKPLDDLVDPSLVAWTDYGPTTPGFFAVNSFSDDVEKFSHNPAHGWPCAGGNVTNPNRSASDPLFYLLHSQIDREWAYWQQKHNRFGVVSAGALTFPAPAHYDNNGNWNTPGNVADADFRQKGSFLLDGLWPWDGTTDGPTSTPEWRPPNQAGGPGDVSPVVNIPASTPLIPTTAFPASVRRNLWPSVATIPRNADMIDYLGKFLPQNGLGMCYDDVPY